MLVRALVEGVDPRRGPGDVAARQSEVYERSDAILAEVRLYRLEAVEHRARSVVGKEPRCFLHVGAGQSSGFLDSQQIEVPEAVLEFLHAVALVRNERVVVERLVYDHAQHSTDEGGLAAELRTQPHIGETGKLRLALVDDYQLGPLLYRFLDRYGDHVLFLCHVARYDQEALGIGETPDRIGSGSVAQHGLQREEELGAQIGRYIYVVRAHDDPGELLGGV